MARRAAALDVDAGLAAYERMGADEPDLWIMSETDDAYVVTAELPGLKKDDVMVEADNQLLTISGSKEDEQKSVRKHHQYAERRYGAFKRILTLPRDADVEAVDAVFKNGVLTVTLPKRKDLAAGRKVPVK